MTAASALAAGPQATPALAESAVQAALAAAGLHRAEGVVLFLSQDFSQDYRAALIAAARAAGCLSVFGSLCQGLFSDDDWVLDQPAAAALVLDRPLLTGGLTTPGAPRLVIGAASNLPADWAAPPPRAGFLNGLLPLWAGGRGGETSQMEFAPAATRCRIAVSSGLVPLGPAQPLQAARGLEALRVGHLAAAESLCRQLPPEWRARQPLPLHALAALPGNGSRAVPILSVNGDGSVTLGEPLAEGTLVAWGVRQPLSAEREMRQSLEAFAGPRLPDFALMFSCIGRGPLFYGGEDRDLAAFRQIFPGVPLIGAYGTAQIAPAPQGDDGDHGNRLLHHSVVTALFDEDNHVQPQPR